MVASKFGMPLAPAATSDAPTLQPALGFVTSYRLHINAAEPSAGSNQKAMKVLEKKTTRGRPNIPAVVDSTVGEPLTLFPVVSSTTSTSILSVEVSGWACQR